MNSQKLILAFLFLLLRSWQSNAQPSLYRQFTPTVAVPVAYTNSFPLSSSEAPIPTSDGGFLILTRLYAMGFESPGGNLARTVTKTDANLVPQWQKNYYNACVLPTGGIVLFGQQTIEKVTNAGLTVWTRTLSLPWALNDAVTYSNLVRFVGNQLTVQSVPSTVSSVYITDGLTLAIDTNGNYQSHQLFQSSLSNTFASFYTYRASANFSRIKRDAQGNFYVCNSWQYPLGADGQMAIAKFDPSFNSLWAKTGAVYYGSIRINDFDILPNNRIIATGRSSGSLPYNYSNNAALFKLASNGDVVQEKYFPDRSYVSDLSKLSSNNYIATTYKSDSLFMFEVDTSLSIQWHSYRAKTAGIAGSAVKNGQLYSTFYNNKHTCLISTSLTGQSCASLPMPVSLVSASLSLQNFTLSPVASTLSLSGSTATPTIAVAYQDTCICPPYVSMTNSNICVGNTATVSVIAGGVLLYYSAATGGTPIFGGPLYYVTSNTPTTVTYYLENTVCTNNSPRIPVSVNVYASPNLVFSPANPTLCLGSAVNVTVSGAVNYTWPNTTNQSSVNLFAPSTTSIYTITGSVNANCSNTKTVQITLMPLQNISINGLSDVCLGVPVTYTATGGNSYTWTTINSNSGLISLGTASTAAFTPTTQLTNNIYLYSAAGGGSCATSTGIILNVYISPTITAVALPSVVCGNGVVTLSASGGPNLIWTNIGYAAVLTTPVNNNTIFVVVSSNPGCTSSATAIVQLLPVPQLSITPATVTICSGQSASFTATGANSYTWNNSQVATSYLSSWPVGTHTILLKGSNGSCTAASTASALVKVTPTVNIYQYWPYLCLGKVSTYTAYGANTYTWNNILQSNTYSIVGSTDTLITVSGELNGCIGTSTYSFEAKPNPTVAVSASADTICELQHAIVVASGTGVTYWYGSPQSPTLNLYPGTTTTVVIQGQTQFGCKAQDSVIITVLPRPTLTVTPKQASICKGDVVMHTVLGAQSYTWNNTLNGDTVYTYPSSNQVYTVVGTGTNGCTGSTKVSLNILECVSINENPTAKATFEIYPNPSRGIFYLKYADFTDAKPLLVYSADGRLLFKVPITATSIDLSAYSAGVYYVREESGQGVWMLVKG